MDTGNSIGIILLSTLKQKNDEEKVEKITLNLVGFNQEPSAIISKVVMPVFMQGKTVYSIMMVVDKNFACDAILGHPWLNKMRALISTFHYTIKFPNGNNVETLRSEQRVDWFIFLRYQV